MPLLIGCAHHGRLLDLTGRMLAFGPVQKMPDPPTAPSEHGPEGLRSVEAHPESDVPHEREAVVIEVPERELPRTPLRVIKLGVLMKDAFVLVLVEEQVGIVDDEP